MNNLSIRSDTKNLIYYRWDDDTQIADIADKLWMDFVNEIITRKEFLLYRSLILKGS